MTLSELVDAHASRRLRLTVYGPAPVAALRAAFETPHVAVDWKQLPDSEANGFVAVEDETGYQGTVPLDDVRMLLDPTTIPDPGTPELRSASTRELFERIRDVTFASFDRRQLLFTAREFEDRAWRSAGGALHTGFQRPAAYRAQAAVYRDLAALAGLDVHLYVAPDWSVPDVPGATVHRSGAHDLGDVWFVVFDGGAVHADACALLAVELEADHYYGYWTYDRDDVTAILDTLDSEYA